MAIYWTLGNFLKPLASINLHKSPTFLGIFCKGVKIYHFSSEIIFWATFIDIWRFFSSHTDRNQNYYDIKSENIKKKKKMEEKLSEIERKQFEPKKYFKEATFYR